MTYLDELRKVEFEAMAALIPWTFQALYQRYKMIVGQYNCPLNLVIQSCDFILNEYKQRQVTRMMDSITKELNLPGIIVPML